MENEQAEAQEPERAQAPAISVYPALSISKPPPPREKAMTYILTTLFAGAFVLAIAGVIEHYLHAP